MEVGLLFAPTDKTGSLPETLTRTNKHKYSRWISRARKRRHIRQHG